MATWHALIPVLNRVDLILDGFAEGRPEGDEWVVPRILIAPFGKELHSS